MELALRRALRPSSRWLVLVCALATLAAGRPTSGQSAPTSGQSAPPGPAQSQAQSEKAAGVITEARAAIGGEAKLAAVKTFVVTGRTRQVRGDNLVPIEFEIQAELPDKFARRDEFPAQDLGPTVTGFNGDRFVQIPVPQPPPARPGGPPPPTPEQLQAAARVQLTNVKQDFARLMLGLFAASYPSHPLTFAYVGQAEAPQGRADVIDVKGPGNFAARLFVDVKTHLPVMLSWQAQQPPARGRGPGPGGPGGAARPGGPPPGGAPPAGTPAAPPAGAPPAGAPPAGAPPAGAPPAGAPPAGATTPPAGAPPAAAGPPAGPPPAVENRLYFAEYQSFDGLQLPTRVRRAVSGETTEETTFDRFRINARVDPRRFGPGS